MSTEAKYAILSFLKTTWILLLCVAINLIGITASQLTKSLLFIDFAGTAMAALIYGPIHGALVGLCSNYIGEYVLGPTLERAFGVSPQYYFLFSPVHMIAALVWSVTPRLLKGHWSMDIFCDNEKEYPAGRLLIGIVILSLLSHLLSAIAIALIIQSYTPHLGCGVTATPGLVRGDLVLCDLARLAFGTVGHSSIESVALLTMAKLLIGFPDHLISLVSAVLLVSFILDGRRYKMSGAFGSTIVTNRPVVATIFYIGMVFAILAYIYSSYARFGAEATFGPMLLIFGFFVAFQSLLLAGVFRGVLYIKDGNHKAELYQEPNKELKDAFEDSMKLSVLTAVVLYFFVEAIKGGTSNTAAEFFQRKLFGALGVAFLITFVRYIVLILARVIRQLRKRWHRDHFSHDMITD